MAGKLAVSVIEAKRISAADTTSDLSFYVRLRLGADGLAKTETSHASLSPKFLKDLRMSVADPESDVLRVELLQEGPKGDLVVGTAAIRVASLVNKSTMVQWLDMVTFNGAVGARLCVVMRYLSAAASRPMTPSYAIATREARANAVVAAATPTTHGAAARGSGAAGIDGTLQSSGAMATKMLFSDAPYKAVVPTMGAGAGASGAPQMPAQASPSSTSVAAPTPMGAPPQSPVTPEAAPPLAAAALQSRLAVSAGPDMDDEDEDDEPAVAPRVAATTADAAAAPAASSTAGGSQRQRSGRHRAHHSDGLPVPLSIAVGMLAGAAMYMWRRRGAVGTVTGEDDGLCLVSSCFNQGSYEQYRRQLASLEQ
ncbi:hypothetical protein FOA52_016054 [Chlamydomonas sp. UWO 241]|nr:hypothetical protein FOA52_016054 [Chlamydomonas sp. UWO 241]